MNNPIFGNHASSLDPIFGKLRRVLYLALGVVLLLVFFSTFETVPAGFRAVVFNNLGGGMGARGEGVTLLAPFLQSATLYDVRQQTYTMSKTFNEGKVRGDDSVQSLTSDGQQVDLDISVIYHPDPNRIVELHRQIGADYESKVVRPTARSVARTAASRYTVTEVYGQQRAQIQGDIGNELKALFEKNFLVLDSLLVRNVEFSAEFKRAVEQKQVAQQDAERKKYELEKEKIEKERKILEAEGDAAQIKLRGEALSRNPALIQYEYVQKIAPGVQTIISDGRSIFSLGDLVKGNQGKPAARP